MSQHAQSCRVEIGMQAANRWHHQSKVVLPTYRFAVKVTENCVRGVANCPLTIAKLPPVTTLVHHLEIVETRYWTSNGVSYTFGLNNRGSINAQGNTKPFSSILGIADTCHINKIIHQHVIYISS